MFGLRTLPLQATRGPDATAALGALVGVTAVAALGFRLYSRRLRSTDRTAALDRLRRAFRIGFPAVYLLALVAAVATGWFELLNGFVATLPGGETLAAETVSTVVGLAVPGVAVVGAYVGAFPAVATIRDVEVGLGTVLGRLARYAAGLVAVVAVAAAVVVAVSSRLSAGGGLLLAVVAAGAAMTAGSPWLIRLVQSTRSPTDAERERLDRLCAAVGFDPSGVRMLPTADARRAFAVVRGPPGRRHLFVADYLLDELDDDALGGYLAVQAARARALHLEARLTVVVGSLVVAVSLLLDYVSVPGVGGGVAGLAVLAVGAVALWLGRRLVYRADDAAADRANPDAVATALRRFAELNDAPLERGRLAQLRRMEPSLAARLDRLRDRGPDRDSGESTPKE